MPIELQAREVVLKELVRRVSQYDKALKSVRFIDRKPELLKARLVVLNKIEALL